MSASFFTAPCAASPRRTVRYATVLASISQVRQPDPRIISPGGKPGLVFASRSARGLGSNRD